LIATFSEDSEGQTIIIAKQKQAPNPKGNKYKKTPPLGTGGAKLKKQ
jgi:hypothetical protein